MLDWIKRLQSVEDKIDGLALDVRVLMEERTGARIKQNIILTAVVGVVVSGLVTHLTTRTYPVQKIDAYGTIVEV